MGLRTDGEAGKKEEADWPGSGKLPPGGRGADIREEHLHCSDTSHEAQSHEAQGVRLRGDG